MGDQERVGARIATLRKARGLTQRQRVGRFRRCGAGAVQECGHGAGSHIQMVSLSGWVVRAGAIRMLLSIVVFSDITFLTSPP